MEKDWDTERFQIGLMKGISKLRGEVSLKEIMFFQFSRKEESGKRESIRNPNGRLKM